MKKVLILLLAAVTIAACTRKENPYLAKAEQMGISQMAHCPELWQSDFLKKPKWDYTQGLIAKAMLELYQQTGDTVYLNYVQGFADYFIHEDGSIETYKVENYNIDRVNGGNFIYMLQEMNPQPRYEAAIQLLRSQLATHPRTSEGGFWHKKIYPWQMWLDGIYMGEPFYAHYATLHPEEADSIFADVVLQFRTIDRHTLNEATGLNYHGWDESREQEWADSITGCSPHSWGRAEGWYLMAIVDVLDYLPADQDGREDLIAILNRVCQALKPLRDPETKMWYQVPDMPGEEGNYTESTCTAMFIYAMAKGARMGYLPAEFRAYAQECMDGLWNSAVITNEDGTISLTRCCAVAGLGGNPYRSGTYDYYINERIVDNDPKGVGPFILAAIELSK